MAVVFAAAGSGQETGYGGSGFPETLLVAYPAGISAGHALLAFAFTTSAGGSGPGVLDTPAGWYAHPNNGGMPTGGPDRETMFAFIKPAVGTESGNLSINMPADGSGSQGGAFTRMFRFTGNVTSGAAWADFAQSGGSTVGSDASAEYTAVVSSVASQLAVVLIGLRGSDGVANITGESNGDFTQPVGTYSSSDHVMAIQTAAIDAETISGGSATLSAGSVPWASLSFAIKAPSAGVTGTVATAAAAQTFSSTGDVLVSGTVATTSAVQAFSSAGAVLVSGTVATTAAAQVFDADGVALVSGTVTTASPVQVFASTGSVLVNGTVATSAAAQVFDANGSVAGVEISGTLASSSPAQVFDADAAVLVAGTVTTAAAAQLLAVSGGVLVSGTVATGAAAQVFASGQVAPAATAYTVALTSAAAGRAFTLSQWRS